MSLGRGICKVCERFFDRLHVAQVKCKACEEKDEADYCRIRDYLERHNKAVVSDVIRDTGVSLRTVDRLVLERRVYLIDNHLKSAGL